MTSNQTFKSAFFDFLQDKDREHMVYFTIEMDEDLHYVYPHTLARMFLNGHTYYNKNVKFDLTAPYFIIQDKVFASLDKTDMERYIHDRIVVSREDFKNWLNEHKIGDKDTILEEAEKYLW